MEDNNNFEDYLDEIGHSDFGNAVVTGTDWTIESIIRQVEKGNISLSPIFQRRDAWTQERKSLFIESLLIGMPIPQLVLAEDPNLKGRFIVLDGKQRLLSLLQFAAIDSRDKYPALKLKNLPILHKLEKLTYEDLRDNGYNFSTFENQSIRTVIIKNSPSEEMLAQVFYRLNTGSLPLSPQELRFALYPGEFTKFIDIKSEESSSIKYFLGNSHFDFRMRDVELLLRLLTNNRNIGSYRGNLKDYLDTGFKNFTQEFDSIDNGLEALCEQFENAHILVLEIFGEDSYKKYIDGEFESRKNRSIFEVLLYILSDCEVRSVIQRTNVSEFKELFISICNSNRNFINSIEKTTKSISAVNNRFNILISAINEKYGLNIDLVNIGGS